MQEEAHGTWTAAVTNRNLHVVLHRRCLNTCHACMQDFKPFGFYLASSDACLAICLAYERSKGRMSPFYPYISSLPSKTPGFFSKDENEAQKYLKQLGECNKPILVGHCLHLSRV